MEQNIISFLQFHQPTKEQEKVLFAMQNFVQEENQEDFMVVCGAAGTGKTSIVTALVGYLNHNSKPYRIAAPTGRAARIIGKKTESISSTIHTLIYEVETGEDGKVKFFLKTSRTTLPTVYIVDESSMIPSKNDKDKNTLFITYNSLLDDLVKFIKSGNANNKIIFLGDHYQLPPVNEEESLALNKQYLMSKYNFHGEAFELKDVKRQKDGSYILQNATDIRNAIDENKEKMMIQGEKEVSIYKAAENYAKEIKNNGLEENIVIGKTNRANDFFNKLARDNFFDKKTINILEAGDLMIVLKNWHRDSVHIFNGDHVEILEVDWNLKEEVCELLFVAVKVKLLFTEKEVIIDDYLLLNSVMEYKDEALPIKINNLIAERYRKNKIFAETKNPKDDRYVGALQMTYGHAITCNKAQGGEWSKVYINTYGVNCLKWQYTAVTRAKDNIKKF